jgi:hypothetical protein
MLAKFGNAISPIGIRLLDPSRIEVAGRRVARVVDGQGAPVVISWESRLQHAIEQALDGAIAMDAPANGRILAQRIKEEHGIVFSELELDTPQAVLHAVFAAAHVNEVIDIKAENLSYRQVSNAFFETNDVLMTLAEPRPLKEQHAHDQ